MGREHLTGSARVLRRPRVNRQLAAGLRQQLLLVSAGLGYGKSTALADCLRGTRHRLAWLNVLELDNDPARFWLSLRRALADEAPQLERLLADIPLPQCWEGLDRLYQQGARLLEAGPPLVLAIDGLEKLRQRAALGFISGLIRVGPDNLCLVLSGSDRRQLAALAGGRLHGLIGPDVLSFTPGETAEVFRLYGHELTSAQAGQVHAATEGWPLAVQLMAARAPEDFDLTPPLAVTAELFEFSAFSALDGAARQLLVQMSDFDRIPPGLPAALGVADPIRAIETLDGNMFITFDHAGGYYRIQRMYREYLARRRLASDSAGQREALKSAGHFFERSGLTQEALSCFWRAEDFDSYIAAVRTLSRRRWEPQESAQVLARLDALPPAYIQDRAQVDYCRGLMHLNAGRLRQAEGLLRGVARTLEQRTDTAELAMQVDVCSALIDIDLARGIPEALDWAKKAVALLAGHSRLTAPPPLSVGNNGLFFLPDNTPGQWAYMQAFAHRLSGYATQLYGEAGYAFMGLLSAEAAFYGGNAADAMELGLHAVHVAHACDEHLLALCGWFIQLRAALFLGQAESAEAVLGWMDAHVAAHSVEEPRLAGVLDCARVLYAAATGELSGVPEHLSLGGRLPTVHPLENGRNRLAAAMARWLTGDVHGSYSALLGLDRAFAQRHLWGTRLTAHLLKAQCLWQMNRPDKAVAQLWTAYDMAWQNGIMAPFAEFGQALLPLLALAQEQTLHIFSPQWLLDAREAAQGLIRRQRTLRQPGSGRAAERVPPRIALTRREREVLNLLARGLNREELARLMGISLHGVKKHITSIYDKLGAANRADAVHIAIAQGIIDAGYDG